MNLNSAGVNYGEIMILLGNRSVLAKTIQDELGAKGVPFSPIQVEPFRDRPGGRVGFSFLRILADPNDLVAHRDVLSLIPQMGPGRCFDVTLRCRNANLNALDLYQGHIPNGVLTPMQLSNVNLVRAITSTIQMWNVDDTVAQRGSSLAQFIEQVRGPADRQEWDAFIQTIPQDATLGEVCDLLFVDNLEDSGAVLTTIHERLGLPVPSTVNSDRVQILTMHGAKGLSSKVVFIPGLEETIFPNKRRAAKPGLVDEGARLAYVSITRARAAVFLSGTHGRTQNGSYVQNPVSRYLPHSGLTMQYQQQPTGIDTQFAKAIAATCNLL